MDDVEAAVELANAYSMQMIGKPQLEAHELRSDWASPNLNIQTDLHLVFAPDDTLVGYAGVWDRKPNVQIHAWGRVHPEYNGRGIGTYLAQWIERRAHRSITAAPSGTRVVLLQWKPSVDTIAGELLRRHHYRPVRYWFCMSIELDAPPPEPVFPNGITIRPFLHEKHLQDVILADRAAFKDHWGYVESPFEEDHKEWVHWIDNDPDHDPSLWFLAWDGDKIAGLSLCLPKVAEDPESAYVESLGVQRLWRRRGIAMALLHHSFGELYRRGKRRVCLDADAQNLTGATRLYEKAGIHVQRQSVTFEKELRRGVELRTQSVDD